MASPSAPSHKPDKPIPRPSAAARKCRNLCIAISLALLLLLVVLVLVLAFTVFKPKRPLTTINSVDLADLAVSLDIARLAVDINVTLVADISIKNPNKVGFKYADSTALLNYRGELVGQAPVPADQISADQTKDMNITLTIMADRLLSTSRLYSDVAAGSLPFNTFTRISGKVTILGVFKIRVVSTTSCDFNVDISNRKIGDQQCDYHTKL